MGHILVVDDWQVDRHWAGVLLETGTDHFVQYACDGLEALEQMEASLPLAVVTDLQMPNMDGMRLVETIRHRFPHVPTIVMTAHGSEDIAVQALLSGATDYVPKSSLGKELVTAVRSVMEIAAGDRLHRRTSECLHYQELRYQMESDVLLGAAVVDHLRQIATSLALVDPADSIRLAKALIEAMSNAIHHGNLELARGIDASEEREEVAAQRRNQAPYCDRRLYLEARFSREEATFTVRDEGPGFDVAKYLPDVAKQPKQLSERKGRGLVLIHLFMDEVQFNSTGNEIRMTKRARRL